MLGYILTLSVLTIVTALATIYFPRAIGPTISTIELAACVGAGLVLVLGGAELVGPIIFITMILVHALLLMLNGLLVWATRC